MPKPPSTYAARLSEIINVCLDIFSRYGFVSAPIIAEKTGLSDRMVRNYLNDLVDLGVLFYVGEGRYSINFEKLEIVSRIIGLEPRTQLSLDDFVDPNFFKLLESSRVLRERMKKLLDRLGWSTLFVEEVRERIYNEHLPGGIRDLIGDRFIYRHGARRIFLDDIYIGGSSNEYEIENFGISDFSVLTITYLSSASYIAFYKNDVLVREKCLERAVPDISQFYGKEPFVPEEPFYEMTTDFPELLGLGRKIASRLLSQIAHYKLDIAILEKYGDDIAVYFREGSLFPHGYIVRAKKLVELQRKAYDYFQKLLNVSRKKGVLIAGISFRSYDNIFARTLSDYLGVNLATSSDDHVLNALMDDGDVTALIARGPEKGKPTIQNWYEFYIKCHSQVLKVEFISIGDPWGDYEKLRDFVYSSAIHSPRSKWEAGPGPLLTANVLAARNISELQRTIRGVLRAAFVDYFHKLSTGML
ncbi:MAG: hypothetical protein ACTSUJ_04255 [Candidatus Njordarchaeales archaeon]